MAENATRRDTTALQALATGGTVVVASTGNGAFEQVLLDSCTSMTVHMYAARKKWPLEQVVVRLRHSKVYADDCADCEKPTAKIDRIDRAIEFLGALDAEQRSRLLEIANQCPVHRTLSSKIDIKTTAV